MYIARIHKGQKEIRKGDLKPYNKAHFDKYFKDSKEVFEVPDEYADKLLSDEEEVLSIAELGIIPTKEAAQKLALEKKEADLKLELQGSEIEQLKAKIAELEKAKNAESGKENKKSEPAQNTGANSVKAIKENKTGK